MTELPVSKPPIFTSASESVRPSDPVGNDALLSSKPALERTQTIGKTMAETPTSWASDFFMWLGVAVTVGLAVYALFFSGRGNSLSEPAFIMRHKGYHCHLRSAGYFVPLLMCFRTKKPQGARERAARDMLREQQERAAAESAQAPVSQGGGVLSYRQFLELREQGRLDGQLGTGTSWTQFVEFVRESAGAYKVLLDEHNQAEIARGTGEGWKNFVPPEDNYQRQDNVESATLRRHETRTSSNGRGGQEQDDQKAWRASNSNPPRKGRGLVDELAAASSYERAPPPPPSQGGVPDNKDAHVDEDQINWGQRKTSYGWER